MTQAPAELRFLICALLTGTGDPESLANVNTSQYAHGAVAYVISASALFVLDKTSTATVVTGQIVAPGSGPGRWFRLTTVEAKAGAASLQTTGTNAFAAPDGNWGQSTGINFSLVAPTSWVLTAAAGVLTYSGEDRDFLAIVQASAQVGNVGATRNVFVAISKTDDVTGVAASGQFGSQSTTMGIVSQPYSLSAQRRISLVSGDTVRIKAAATAGAAALSFDACSLSLIPL